MTSSSPSWRPSVWTNDGGSTWTVEDLPIVMRQAACVSATTCVLGGFDRTGVLVMGSSDGLRSWSYQALPAGVLHVSGTACVSLRSCTIAAWANRGGVVYMTPNGGTGWARVATPPGMAAPTGISCPTSTFCAAAANGILTSVDAGRSWALHRLVLGTSTLQAISCVSSDDCVIVGDNTAPLAQGGLAQPLVYVWRGRTLSNVSFSGHDASLDAVSCTRGGTCVAVGSSIEIQTTEQPRAIVAYSHDGGASWTTASLPSISSLYGVSCIKEVCVAVGDGTLEPLGTTVPKIVASTNGGVTWRAVPTVSRGITDYVEVACASATRCIAAGDGYRIVGGSAASNLVSALLVAPRPGAPFQSVPLGRSQTYRTVGTTSGGALFGVPASAPMDQPFVVRVPG
jgi:hypothetical protein